MRCLLCSDMGRPRHSLALNSGFFDTNANCGLIGVSYEDLRLFCFAPASVRIQARFQSSKRLSSSRLIN